MSTPLYVMPQTVAKAISLANNDPAGYVFYAGGTDIQLHIKQHLIQPDTIIDLTGVKSLKKINSRGGRLVLGAMVTLDQIIHHQGIRANYPIIAVSATSVATPVVRKTATLGGNLMVSNRCSFYNQSFEWRQSIGSCLKDTGDFCQVTGGLHHCYSRNVSDLAPALMALNARVTVRSVTGKIYLPMAGLYVPDGLIVHAPLGAGGIITEIMIPEIPSKWWFKKLRLRNSMDFTSLTVAACVDNTDNLRVAVNGVSMAPVGVEAKISNLTLTDLIRQVKRTCKTVDNDYLPLQYRREMISAFLTECWESFH